MNWTAGAGEAARYWVVRDLDTKMAVGVRAAFHEDKQPLKAEVGSATEAVKRLSSR
jgi:hypothetical protein